MTSRERFLAALHGGEPDRPPVAHVSALTTVELQETTGCFMPNVHLDAHELVRLCAANHELLGFDAVTFIINYFGEPAAIGCEMDWGAERQLPMYLSHPWASPQDAVLPSDLLDKEPIRTCLEAISIAHRDHGHDMAVMGKVMGPLSMVQVMRGPERAMMDMIEDPQTTTHFLNVAVDILVRHANAQLQAGADAVAIGEGGAGANMVSPRMHEDLLLEPHRRMIASIDGPTIMHICGDITPRLDVLAQTGLTCFNFDWDIEPRVMKDASREAFTIMGNVNTTDLLRGTPADVEKQVIDCLEAGVDIISPGCAISPECPNANLRAISETVARWRAP